jgi:flagellar basal body-associated protein FliL
VHAYEPTKDDNQENVYAYGLTIVMMLMAMVMMMAMMMTMMMVMAHFLHQLYTYYLPYLHHAIL